MTAVVDVNLEEYNKLLEDSSTLKYLKDAIYTILLDENTDLLDVALKTMEILKIYD